MTWIKRNLFFVIGSVVAFALLGLAGYYLYQKSNLNTEVKAKLNETYEALLKLNNAKPHPGDGKNVDNIDAAKKQEAQLRQYIEGSRKLFTRIPAIPDTPKVASDDFAAQLRQTIDQLQKGASIASVSLPPRYEFSFLAQKTMVKFTPGSLEPLSVQVGEIKAICDVLFHAKINSLDSLRRERVSMDDQGTADYHEQRSVTNDLGVLTPYEVTFRCFSSELASVLAGFASSPYCFIVKAISVEPGASEASPGSLPGVPSPAPVFTPAPAAPVAAESAADAFARRYGTPPGGFGKAATIPPPFAAAPPVATASGSAPGARGGQLMLVEKQIKVTLAVALVKLRPPK